MSLHDNGVAFAQWDNRPFCRARKVSIAKAKEPLKDFNVMERLSITQYANDLTEISNNLCSASKDGSKTAARLHGIAERQSRNIETRLEVNGKEIITIDHESLKTVMAVSQVANEAARTPMQLLAANKDRKVNGPDRRASLIHRHIGGGIPRCLYRIH